MRKRLHFEYSTTRLSKHGLVDNDLSVHDVRAAALKPLLALHAYDATRNCI
jgi:hypothetical protein